MSPADRAGLHPLLIPLAAAQQQQEGSSDAGEELTCLLRWPEGHKGMELPVVSMARGGTQVRGGASGPRASKAAPTGLPAARLAALLSGCQPALCMWAACSGARHPCPALPFLKTAGNPLCCVVLCCAAGAHAGSLPR